MGYHLVAYKSNGVDYCRGCRMDSCDSELEIHSFDTQEKLVGKIAEYKFNDRNVESWIGDFSFIVFKGEQLLNEWDGVCYEGGEKAPNVVILQKAQAQLEEMVIEFDKKEKERKEKEAIRAEEARAKKEKERLIAKEKHDREEYQRLKAKFG